jgi:hypothetical protein
MREKEIEIERELSIDRLLCGKKENRHFHSRERQTCLNFYKEKYETVCLLAVHFRDMHKKDRNLNLKILKYEKIGA